MAIPSLRGRKAAPPPADEASADEGGGTAVLTGDARQFVTFQVDGETFGVSLAEVQEIIRMPDVVELPLSPAALVGIANLRGTVLPIASLRSLFGMAEAPYDDATRVVVVNCGVPIGLIVDRMSSVLTVEADQVEDTAGIEAAVATELLTGLIRHESGMIMLFDAAQVLQREFAGNGGRTASGPGTGGGAPGPDERREAAVDELQLVSFEVAGQEYALPIEQVKEIVQVPPSVSRVPRTDSHVLGVMTLRERLLPLVSLRAMLALPEVVPDEHQRIVVIGLPDDGEGEVVAGVVTDTVREVLRVPRTLVEAVPALIAQGRASELAAICRLEQGKRLVTILAADRMLRAAASSDAVQAARSAAGEDDMGTTALVADDEEQFVVFRLADEEYGVPIAAVHEIVRVPEELTRLPKTPSFIEGVVNLRGSVLPVVDQRRRFGLAGLARTDRQRIMVYRLEGVATGFIVDSVSEVLKIPRRTIEQAPDLSAEQARLIGRVANLETQKRMILLLDVERLLGADELAAAGAAARAA